MRLPITLFREGASATEWRELSCSRHYQGLWVVCERHSWPDFENQKPHFTMDILNAPLKTEDEANAALDARVRELEKDGWVHKVEMSFDEKTGIPIRSEAIAHLG
jgi:hypothetical protein